jgi:hypothetical protein
MQTTQNDPDIKDLIQPDSREAFLEHQSEEFAGLDDEELDQFSPDITI